MLFKSTLKLLLVETPTKQLLVPIVSNSYKKTLWLLHHRDPEVKAVGVIEGRIEDMSFLQVGEVDIAKVHRQVMIATNVLYISIGKHVETPGIFVLDYSLPIEDFILRYGSMYTPDELLVLLGVGHNKLFRTIGELVVAGKLLYVPENGPNKWSFYDYYWLHEKYKLDKIKSLDIKPYINRSNLQIKFRAHAVGFTKKANTKKLVTQEDVTINMPTHNIQNKVTLTAVERDYMLSQISDTVNGCIAHIQ